jgi:hypothetical protein
LQGRRRQREYCKTAARGFRASGRLPYPALRYLLYLFERDEAIRLLRAG